MTSATPPAGGGRTTVRRYLAAILVTAGYALPLYLAIVNVFKPNAQITAHPMSLPSPFTLGNLISVFDSPDYDLVGTLVRTLVITAVSMACVVLLGSMLGYYLGRHQGPLQRVLTGVLLLGLAIPFQVILIPVTQVLRPLNLLNTYAGLVVFNVGYYIPFAVLVFSRFVREIPRELDEAAALDGAGPVRIFTRVVFPLMHPAMASVAIFVSVWVWNDFVNPLILLGPDKGTTIMTGIYRSLGQFNSDFGTTFAFMFVASLPLLILFLLLQKRFVSGLTSGATKG
ncbi:carbohydrate ABC transporter permease [Streptomyces sp. NPDC004542]|uniref:carbohydrate ABC transporter permease n=1 Tax=Streptomyces sp. NPDC004542 TaxID=3154281 RepID=UPI0033BB1B16